MIYDNFDSPKILSNPDGLGSRHTSVPLYHHHDAVVASINYNKADVFLQSNLWELLGNHSKNVYIDYVIVIVPFRLSATGRNMHQSINQSLAE